MLSYERLNFQTAAGKAKVLGTITGIGGAMLLTFLKGVEINIWTFHINLLHKGKNGTLDDNSGSKLLGIFFGLGSCFCFALWLIIQVKIIKITCIEFLSICLVLHHTDIKMLYHFNLIYGITTG